MVQPTPYRTASYNADQATGAIWLICASGIIFFMQMGFAMLECGSIRAKNAKSILIKNMFDAVVGFVGFWLIGYAIAFGDPEWVIGGHNGAYYATSGFERLEPDNYLIWIFEASFAATAATIVSGSLAERCQMNSYLIFTFTMTSFVYPVVVSWYWGHGWLYKIGFHDFAGSASVHLVGGSSAFWGALILGQRYGYHRNKEAHEKKVYEDRQNTVDFHDHEFEKFMHHVNVNYHQDFREWLVNQTDEFKPSDQGMILQGVLFLWAAWLFFNGGSAMLNTARYEGPAKVLIVNFLAPATGGIVAVLVKPRVVGTYSQVQKMDILTMCNGCLCGLVSVTSSCDQLEPYMGVISGAIGATLFSFGCLAMEHFEVDDPCEAFPLHLSGGITGTLGVGLFSSVNGLFYNPDIKMGFRTFGVQCLGAVCILTWVSIMSILMFGMLKITGLFRIEKEIEIIGLDAAEAGGIEPEVYEKIRAHSFISRAQSTLSIYSPVRLPGQKDRFKERKEFGSYAGINKSEQQTVGGSVLRSFGDPRHASEEEQKRLTGDVILEKDELSDV